jgi:hypothetical protein
MKRDHVSHVSSHIPSRHHRTKPTPPDEWNSDSRVNPTPPNQSDRLPPPHNPSVVGSMPTGPTVGIIGVMHSKLPLNFGSEIALGV